MIASVPPAHGRVSAHAAPLPRHAGTAPSIADFLGALMPDASGEDEPATDRQPTPESGKTLPVLPDPAALAWLMPVPPTPTPVAAPTIAGTAAAAPVSLAPAVAGPAMTAAEAPPGTAGDVALSDPAPLPPAPALLALARDPALAAANGPVTIELPAEPARREPAIVAEIAPGAVAPAVPTVAAGTSAPAGQIFAAALHAAAREDKAGRAQITDGVSQPQFHATADATIHAVAATGNAAGGGALDMRDERWPHAMMDRIERLRDEANAADTRIRLVPDQLGGIDVAVRREGDTLHVRFHAEQAATRDLLADAQPRLAAIAEQRGLKLGDAQVGGGTGGDPRQPPRAATTPAAPPRATAAAELDDATDIRIA